MTWQEIKQSFPNEWVAIINYIPDSNNNLNGEVVFHSDDKNIFYKKAKNIILLHGGMAMRYTGELIKNEEMPLLWQSLHTP